MNKTGKAILIILAVVMLALLFLVGTGGYMYYKSGGTHEGYQHDADIVRLNDLVLLGLQVEKYHERVGRYPLEGRSDLPIYVNIASPEQEKYASGGPPFSHYRTPVSELRDEMAAVLGNEVSIPFDPQRVPVNKPNFYIYVVKGTDYFLAVHVHHDFPFARKVGKFYNKVEIGSTPVAEKRIWLLRELLRDEDFKTARNASMQKPDYFEKLRRQQKSSE